MPHMTMAEALAMATQWQSGGATVEIAHSLATDVEMAYSDDRVTATYTLSDGSHMTISMRASEPMPRWHEIWQVTL